MLSVFCQEFFNGHNLDKYQALQMHLNSAQVNNGYYCLKALDGFSQMSWWAYSSLDST